MTTPRRYGLAKLNTDTRCTLRDQRGLVHHMYISDTEKHQWVGELTDNICLAFADTYEAVETLMHELLRRFPRNSYSIFEVQEVRYVPDAPPVSARFTDEGLLPNA